MQGGGNTLIYNAPNTHQILENFDNKIQGAGQIGDSGGGYNLALRNDAGGAVNADLNGQTLVLNTGGGTTNLGILEATNGGILQIGTTVSNAGGTIFGDGSTSSAVNLNGATIQGGTLQGNVVLTGASTLDGSANTLNNQGTLTINNGVTGSILGTINNTGSIVMAGTGSGTYLSVAGNTTLQGGGTLTLQGGGNTVVYNAVNNHQILENFNNTIQGVGQIGDNNGGYNLTLKNDTGGLVNANISGGTLTLNANTTNAGTLEATGGGILAITNATVNNSGGMISGSGAVVNLSGATIQGGTLNGNVHVAGESLLDGSTQGTLNNQGVLTINNGVRADIQGTINNSATILLAGTGSGTLLNIANNTTLQGGGALTLQGGGNTSIYNVSNNHQVLENFDNHILGTGVIGDNNGGYNLVLQNDSAGIVNANVSGATLTLNTNTNNTGTLEATSGGILAITNATVNNNGGTISTDGSSVVNLSGATIQGGTLNGNVYVTMKSLIDGTTEGILTNAGTLTVNNGVPADIQGTINNTGSILLAGTGSGTNLNIANNTTLQGGGTLTLQGGRNTLQRNQQSPGPGELQ
jgi:hypothetical protein